MKLFKLLPLSLAVAGTLASAGAFAAENNQELIDALEARLAEVEARVGGEFNDTQQPAVLNAQSEVPLGIVFSGYARYGAGYQGSDSLYVGTDGSLNANATGRLGNEQNGGEIQFAKAFESDAGAIWDVVFMVDHWSDASWATNGGVQVKKLYAGASNVFESQPDLYIWAGRDFHQRPQTDLDDYFWMSHDGQGAGFYNMDLGALKFDLGVVGQVDGEMVGDNGRYAVTSKFHGMEFGGLDLSFYANYGFKSEKLENDNDVADSAYQVAAEMKFSGQKFIVRYADNAKDSVYDLAEDQTALLFSLGGGFGLTDKAGLQYQAAYQMLEGDAVEDRANYNIIVRPTYQWNDVHSTWLEGGYSVVDYDDIDATNQSWKVTLSQNIAIGPETWSRPMLRFYATVGNSDNEYSGKEANGDYITRDEDTLTVGAMFEAWW
ncbi:lactam utilization protein LamB [Vibrio breoganii]|uniref:carbohydrate porin n=1 Tax=Vibrio breoganii TaxID=553239 RepID=UPI0003018527|nr:carbohydrate porin [Vibrio breoganii]OED88501.1 lactam utilization protein LamB [Vibrio breoganii ZF-55]OED94561.1 lactam utilization protein LamB [Vibrio breoganii ZF-29]OEF82356.1 lactam utilization protein LamB [Vibrio breoganii 1C10]PMK99838.1 lactam utilization protein LamB [Vibrio breoganii]PMM11882.1 lactam utilization protein LamB [Vibrio breoganii]